MKRVRVKTVAFLFLDQESLIAFLYVFAIKCIPDNINVWYLCH